MSQKKIKKKNLENLIEISESLKNFEHFVFYGTLLGLTRENDILKNDDDIDFLVNINDKDKILNIFKKSEIFKINEKVSNNFFVQLVNIKEDFKTFVDLYFYLNEDDKDFLVEKHNFLSAINIESKSIHIPKKIIFPIKKKESFFNINVPNMPKEVCEFLYGENWLKPLRKNSGYRMEVVGNKPKLIKRSFLGSLTRRIKEIFNNEYKKK